MEEQKKDIEVKPKKSRAANRFSTREFVDSEKAVNEGERTIVHTISSSMIDRYGEIVDPAGMVETNYAKNPVVLFGHNNGDAWLSGAPPVIPVIGKSLWRKTQDEKILSKTKFGDSTDFMEDAWNLAKDGFLPATSIGFIPLAYEVKKLKEITDLNPSNRDGFDSSMDVFIWRKWELLEYSLVVIPANPEALQNALERSSSRLMRSMINSELRLCTLEGCKKDMDEKLAGVIAMRKSMEEMPEHSQVMKDEFGKMMDNMADMAKRMKEMEDEMSGMKEFSAVLPELSKLMKENLKKVEIAVSMKEIDAIALVSRSVDRAISRMRGKITD